MKKYPKLVQVDQRGVIVIPKDVRRELGIEEGTGFWVYLIGSDGLFLQKAKENSLENNTTIDELHAKSSKVGIKKESVQSAKIFYKKTKKNNFDVID